MLSSPLLKKQKLKGTKLRLREFSHLFMKSRRPMLHYIVPETGWSTNWTGYYLTEWVNKLGMQSHVCHKPPRVKGDILHYGSTEILMKYNGLSQSHANWLVSSFFYDEIDNNLAEVMDRIAELSDHLNKLVVSSEKMIESFLDCGVHSDKLVCIPLGVDINSFFQASIEEKQILRNKYEISEEAFCIGSFQKDGLGWDEGDEPKLHKGPDVFLETVEQLKLSIPSLFIFLTGPARGYVKAGLEKLDVPYRHILVEDYHEIRDCYACLDAYLVTSREDSGPHVLLEAMACGIPVVSTRVGMAPDIIQDRENGLLSDIEDVKGLASSIEELATDNDILNELVVNGLDVSRQYDWSEVAALYFEHVYAPLMVQRYS